MTQVDFCIKANPVSPDFFMFATPRLSCLNVGRIPVFDTRFDYSWLYNLRCFVSRLHLNDFSRICFRFFGEGVWSSPALITTNFITTYSNQCAYFRDHLSGLIARSPLTASQSSGVSSNSVVRVVSLLYFDVFELPGEVHVKVWMILYNRGGRSVYSQRSKI